jgi:hypothetical protein
VWKKGKALKIAAKFLKMKKRIQGVLHRRIFLLHQNPALTFFVPVLG